MPKGIPNKRYTSDFKVMVVEAVEKEGLSYCEAARRFEVGDDKRVAAWEGIYLTEGPEGLGVERRGRGSKGRPAKHTSAAARKAAHRAEKARVDFTDKPEIIAKLRETAAQLDCSVNELLQSMVRFAECNRNWKQVGLYGSRRDGVLQ